MFAIPRKTVSLKVLEILKYRSQLTNDDEAMYYNLSKGYQGERRFATLLKKELQKELCVLYDILLEKGTSCFQMDSLIIQEGQIHLLEIKNFHDDYYYQDNDFYLVKTGKRIKNPFHQLQRCEDLLRELLMKFRFQYSITSYVIFVHPEFTLYQAPLQLNMILPTQLNRFIRKLNQQPVRTTRKEQSLIHMFHREHIQENRFEKIPNYHYHDLKKGFFCLTCSGEMSLEGKGTVSCKKCGAKESIESAILRNVIEFNVLFSSEKIYTNRIHEWCGGIVSVKVIRRVLVRYLCLKGGGRASYFEFLPQISEIRN